MKVHIDRAPYLIQHFFDVAERSKGEYERWMLKADSEPDPELRRGYEELAACSMDISNGMLADADELMEKFRALGGTWERRP